MIDKEFLSNDYNKYKFERDTKLYKVESIGNNTISEWVILKSEKRHGYDWFSVLRTDIERSRNPKHCILCSIDPDIKEFFIDCESAKKAWAFTYIKNEGKSKLPYHLKDQRISKYAKMYIEEFPERCI